MWNIVTDSSCDDIRFEEKREDILYQSVPFSSIPIKRSMWTTEPFRFRR